MNANGSVPGKRKVAILGTGNIGTDLMIKILSTSQHLEMAAFVGIDPASDGLARAQRMGVPWTAGGIEGLLAMHDFDEIEVVFDATSAKAHEANFEHLAPLGKLVVDLTPAGIGPLVVPTVNLEEHLHEPNVNMVTCGGQATIPIVAAVSAVAPVVYAEIVASIASRSAGPGTRANIDEFTETTARGLAEVGGATSAKAVIVLNPAEPPLIMRDTIFCLVDENARTSDIAESVDEMVARVCSYVPGYRLKQAVQFEHFSHSQPLDAPSIGFKGAGLKVSVFLEIEGAAHYLPAYAGNLDIMTAAALQTAESIVQLRAVAST